MSSFKFFWTTHKWTGIILAVFFVLLSVTGFLLLIKKQSSWIQPPTMKGAAGNWQDFIPTTQLIEIVLAQEHADFQSVEDIDRVDFRPDKRVFKVQSVHGHVEMQVDAISGEILLVDVRRSDLIENLHDGSFFADWIHDWIMPLVAIALLFLVGSGLWLWIEPKLRRRRRKKRAAARAGT